MGRSASAIFITLTAIVFTFFAAQPARAVKGVDRGDLCKNELSIASLVRTPRAGIQPAYSIEVGIQGEIYKVTFAMRQASAQSSRLLIQIFAPGNFDQTKFIEDLIFSVFKAEGPIERFAFFDRLNTVTVHRDELEAGVKKINEILKKRFSSVAKTHGSVSLRARTSSADVAEAARMLTNYVKRNRVVADVSSVDHLLNRAHSRLIINLTERELRFFDYALFDEVLTYEQDQKMQKIAESVAGVVSEADRDYAAIHSGIREKFAKIVRELSEVKRFASSGHLQNIKEHLSGILSGGEQYLAAAGSSAIDVDHSSETVKGRVPFRIAKFKELTAFAQRNLTFADLAELNELLDKSVISQPKLKWWISLGTKDDPLGRMLYSRRIVKDEIEFLQQQVEFEAANELAVEEGRRRMYVKQTVVAPGNGAANVGGNLGEGAGLGESFITQPRRLNSGPGNRRERFDYDTPELD